MTHIANITYDVVLGSIDNDTVAQLNEALETIRAGVDLTQTQRRSRDTPEAA